MVRWRLAWAFCGLMALQGCNSVEEALSDKTADYDTCNEIYANALDGDPDDNLFQQWILRECDDVIERNFPT